MSRRQRALSTRWRAELEAIAIEHATALDVLRCPGRSRRIHMPARRACYAYLIAQGWSLPEIGALFNRDHTTVLYGLDESFRGCRNDARKRRRVALLMEDAE